MLSESSGSGHSSSEGTGILTSGIKNGHWTETLAKGSRYEGEYRDGERHGHGIYTSSSGSYRYEGEWRDGRRHGHGIKISYDSGKRSEGEWRDGRRHGYTTWTRADGSVNTCEYRNGKIIGETCRDH